MKTADLLKLGLTKNQIKVIMSENGKDIKKIQKKLQLENEEFIKFKKALFSAKENLSELNDSTHKKDNLSKEELAIQLVIVDKHYQKKLLEERKKCVIEKLFGEVAFASKLAKKAAMDEFRKEQLPFENNEFKGVKNFFDELKKKDPAAFREETAISIAGLTIDVRQKI